MYFQVSLNSPTLDCTLFLSPCAYGTQGNKGCYLFFFCFFSSCFSLKFFSVVVFLFVHRDAKEAFSLFPFSSFFFAFCVVFLFACFFFLLRSIRENWTKINIVWIDIVYIWVKEFVVRLMMLLLFLYKASILGKI